MIYERYEDCGEVEKIIWKLIAKDYGDFAGVQKLNLADLYNLNNAIQRTLYGHLTVSDDGYNPSESEL